MQLHGFLEDSFSENSGNFGGNTNDGTLYLNKAVIIF